MSFGFAYVAVEERECRILPCLPCYSQAL